ncbi:MAG: hypothetical protein IH608_09045 [Proteobacteria bacterium]|nr:hypothetical protein [Pseudomonadota bacterium]
MVEVARDMVVASLPAGMDEVGTKVALSRRFYVDDLGADALLEAEEELRLAEREAGSSVASDDS